MATVAWTAIAFALPFYRALPAAPRTIWFATAFALIVGSLLLKRVARPLYPAVWIFFGFASCVAIATATIQSSISENIFVGAQLVILLGLGAFVMTANALIDPSFIKRVGTSFVLAQSLSALAGIAQVLGQATFGYEASFGRAAGLAGHPNILGLMSCIAILLALAALFSASDSRTLTGSALAINIASLLASGSLSALLATVVGVFVFGLCMRRHLTKSIVVGATFVVTLWMIASWTGLTQYLRSPADRYRQVTGQTDAESTWEIRKRTYEFAWTNVMEQPIFGRGLSAEYGGTFDGATLTHNIFLRSWHQGGMFLAVASALTILCVVLVAFKAVREERFACEAGVLCAVIAFALTSAFFEQPYYWLPVLAAWGSISAVSAQHNRQRTPTRR